MKFLAVFFGLVVMLLTVIHLLLKNTKTENCVNSLLYIPQNSLNKPERSQVTVQEAIKACDDRRYYARK
jgi:hypothetical protein